jgi:hypothetical protein
MSGLLNDGADLEISLMLLERDARAIVDREIGSSSAARMKRALLARLAPLESLLETGTPPLFRHILAQDEWGA